jgi:hypothetical protein
MNTTNELQEPALALERLADELYDLAAALENKISTTRST